jgi:hypothetical protein
MRRNKPPVKTFKLDKTEAIKCMLDGFPVIPMTVASKQSYKGEFICYWNETFINVNGQNTEEYDTNIMSSKFWELAKLTVNMFPTTLYRAHIKKAEVLELEFKSIFKHDWNWHQRHKLFLPTAICEYQDVKTGLIYSVMFNLEAKSMRKGTAALELIINTDKVEKTKAHANWWFKNYVEEQITIQKKRSGRKPPIKTMEIVDKIQQKIPEALI